MRLSKLSLLFASVAALAMARAPAAQAAAQRPNFLVIVADDLGYSDLGVFGGEIATPNLDAIAQRGVRLTGFHTAPTCSPTRSMLLTGADNHEVGLGSMAEALTPIQRGHEGYEGYLNDRAVTVAELLEQAGYQTLMAGKWHLGLTEDRSPAARGFDKSFAMLQGLQNHFGANQSDAWEAIGERSTFRDGRKLVAYPTGAYDADVFADKMIGFLKDARRDQPFFAYLTFTEPHWPLQAPPEIIAKYKGRYDAGPEALREARLARQKALGLVPADVQPHAVVDVPAWESLTPAERAIEVRKMEIYAAMVDRLDQNVGRVLRTLKATGQLDNTVIIFISDNGPEGSRIDHPGGHSAKGPSTPEQLAAVGVDNSLENLGRANSYVGYGPAWAQASSAPSRLFKGYTTEGGIHTTAFVAGPGVVGGRISNAFLHVKDITPTVLDLAGVEHPDTWHGHAVLPLEGHSWAPLLHGEGGAVRPATEAVGWELFFRRAIRQGDWKAVYLPPSRGKPYELKGGQQASWELYNLHDDPAEAHDLAAQEPERLKSLVAAWDAYAQKTGVVIPPAEPAAPIP
jgi:arylsulfatase